MATKIFRSSAFAGMQLASILLFSLTLGCSDFQESKRHTVTKSFHSKFQWRAKDYFDNPNVVELCEAIESNDLEKMERLIANGVDVNTKGKGNMTPLMWSFPDNKLERFTMLLKHGADPNVKITSDLGIPSAFRPGDSVTCQAAKTRFPGYFEAVMKAGGDPNIADGSGMSMLHVIVLAMLPDALNRAEIAVKQGADLKSLYGGKTLPVAAVVTAGQYDLALYFLEAGCDHLMPSHNKIQRLIHSVILLQKNGPSLAESKRVKQQLLIDWLVDHGEDLEEAKADVSRWASFSRVPGEFQRQWQEEVERKSELEKRRK